MVVEQKECSIKNLAELLQRRGNLVPDKIIYSFLDASNNISKSISYIELQKQALSVNKFLASHSETKDRIALLFPQCAEFLYAFWGCVSAGRIAVPLPPPRMSHLQETLSKIKSIIDSAQPLIILTTREIKQAVDSLPKETHSLSAILWLTVEDCVASASSDVVLPESIAPDDVAMLQYTSGSTSLPKGVILTHHNLLKNIQYFEQAMVHDTESKILTWLPPFHDLGLIYGLLTPIFIDATCFIMPGPVFTQQPSRWIQAMSDHRITHTAAPNFAYDIARRSVTEAQRATLDLSCWVSALNGGEPVRAETMKAFTDYFMSAGFDQCVFNPCWGLAEASCIVTGTHNNSPLPCRKGRLSPQIVAVNRLALAEGEVVLCDSDAPEALMLCSSGSPLLDTRLSVVDPQRLILVEPHRVGEIWIANQAVSSGYWMQPEQNQSTFGWQIAQDNTSASYMRTGDLGFLLDGQLFVTGRLKDTLIIRGRCHYPQDIEALLEKAHPGIKQGTCSVFSLQSADREVIAAVIEVSRHVKIDKNASEIFGLLRRSVAEDYGLQLSAITLIAPGSLPRTTSGKVQRSKAKKQFISGTLKVKAQWMMPDLARELSALNTPDTMGGAHTPGDEKAIIKWLTSWVASTCGLSHDDIHPFQTFSEFGLDSSSTVLLSGALTKQFGLTALSPSVAYDYPTLETLAEYIEQCLNLRPEEASSGTVSDNSERRVAVIGMAFSFPGAANIEEFWSLMASGSCSVGELQPTRQTLLRRLGGDLADIPGGYLDDIDKFDPTFFNISPREAEQIDPQQRLLLQTAWHAFEQGGLTREILDRSRTGVFVALCSTDYAMLCAREGISLEGHAGAGLATSIAASRISYCFNLTGPSMVIDTACSSSLVALHQAIQSLERGECEQALVAGVNVILSSLFSGLFKKAGMLSPTGRCHSFDKSADGYVRSEGVAAIVLTRADVARRNKKRILAWIAGSAVNQDGRSFGLTAPNGIAQREVMRAALSNAGLSAGDVNYIEAHGTGTVLGDAIEYSALSDVYGGELATPCRIGAVKANIGHLEAVAGLAGVIKVILCLQKQCIPPIAGFTQLNPTFPLTEGLKFNTGSPEFFAFQYAGVTSMGFGGTNAHVILQRASHAECTVFKDGPRILTLGAASASSLTRLAALSAELLKSAPEQWQNFSSAAAQYRSLYPYRWATVAHSATELIDALLSHAQATVAPAVHRPPRVAFVFSGQGIQQVGMGQLWYQQVTIFRQKIDECDALLISRADVSIRGLFDGSLSDEKVKERIAQTSDAQLMIAACELALAAWIEACGIQPDCVFGHSLGEYVAAHIAGVLNLSDTLYLIHVRGQAMNAAPDGKMLAVRAPAETVQALIQQHQLDVELAAINSADDVTVSGSAEGIYTLTTLCESARLAAIPVNVAKAFHSVSMTDAAVQLGKVAAEITHYPPRLPLFGNSHGGNVEHCNGDHWAVHLREAVLFKTCAENALLDGYTIMIELGGRALQSFLSKIAEGKGEVVAFASGPTEWENALTTFARLYMFGLSIDWSAIYGAEISTPDVLPAYPFNEQSYWLDKTASALSLVNRVQRQPETSPVETPVQQATINTMDELKAILGELLKLSPEQLDSSRSFLDLGADSLVLMQMASIIEKKLAVKVTIQQLFNQENTLDLLNALVAPSAKKHLEDKPLEASALTSPQESFAAKSLKPTLRHNEPIKTPLTVVDNYQALFQQQLNTFKSMVDAQIAFMQAQAQATVTPHLSKSDGDNLTVALNHCAVAAFTHAFSILYNKIPQPTPLSVDELAQKIGVIPQRLRLWRQICAHLAVAGVISIRQNKVEYALFPDSHTAMNNLEAALDVYRDMLSDVTQADHCSRILLRCARELPAVILGENNGTDVLFCDNGMEEIAALYQSAPGTKEVHEQLNVLIEEALTPTYSSDRSRHILEVGAGTGTTTRFLLPALNRLQNIEPHYLFTDISPAFIYQARNNFSCWGYVDFAVFDLENNSESPLANHPPFELIIAANVVHSTLDLADSLDNLQRLLKPNGAILLIECIEQHPWLDLVFGLTEGWWRYADTALRQHGPLLDEEAWHRLLSQKGWREIKISNFAQTQALIYARY